MIINLFINCIQFADHQPIHSCIYDICSLVNMIINPIHLLANMRFDK